MVVTKVAAIKAAVTKVVVTKVVVTKEVVTKAAIKVAAKIDCTRGKSKRPNPVPGLGLFSLQALRLLGLRPDAAVNGYRNSFVAGVDMELLVQFFDMRPDGIDADKQFFCEHLVGKTVDQSFQNLHLSF